MNEKQTGGISVSTENIFPVIKKWLYSEKDIFLREILSNATDAITKLKRLSSLGQYTADDTPYRIDVRLDKAAKTLTVEDNGIGMSDNAKHFVAFTEFYISAVSVQIFCFKTKSFSSFNSPPPITILHNPKPKTNNISTV